MGKKGHLAFEKRALNMLSRSGWEGDMIQEKELWKIVY